MYSDPLAFVYTLFCILQQVTEKPCFGMYFQESESDPLVYTLFCKLMVYCCSYKVCIYDDYLD